MKMFTALMREIKNVRDGHHLNSAHWRRYKSNLEPLPQYLFEVAIGTIISDATMYRASTEALIKFEQGYAQEEYVRHLFDLFKSYCFMTQPGVRMAVSGPRNGLVKSYWFKTFSFGSFTVLWDLFYVNGVKIISKGLVTDHVTAISLAHWVMGDGSLAKDGQTMILHTQGFTREVNEMIASELNAKFGFNTQVISHKVKYTVIKFARTDGPLLRKLIEPHIIPVFAYKLPRAY